MWTLLHVQTCLLPSLSVDFDDRSREIRNPSFVDTADGTYPVSIRNPSQEMHLQYCTDRLRHYMRDRSTGLMAYMDRKMMMIMIKHLISNSNNHIPHSHAQQCPPMSSQSHSLYQISSGLPQGEPFSGGQMRARQNGVHTAHLILISLPFPLCTRIGLFDSFDNNIICKLHILS